MSTLERARLEPAERRVLDELVGRLRVELAGDLLAVWLYGSRARGEQTGEDSDVDLLVFTARGREDSDIVRRLVDEAADAAGGRASTFSARVFDRDDLEHGRRVHSFYFREVDRDKLVLHGDDLRSPRDEGGATPELRASEGRMRPRSEEFMAGARRYLAGARAAVGIAGNEVAVSSAYYASFYAARAALSEEDRYAKTHNGTWALFHRTFVATDRFPSDTYGRARASESHRLDADYNVTTFPEAEATRILTTASDFVEAVERLLP